MILFLRKIHRILYFGSVLFFFIPCYPILLFYSSNTIKYFKQIVFIRKWISLLSLYTVGIRIKVKFESDIDWQVPYVICPNHTSILDIAILNYICPQQFSFMGKVELLKNPVTRIFFKTVDIPVDRSSRISSFQAFKKGNELLKEGKSLVIFPEGKIDDAYPPKLQPFKSGSFRIAIDNGVAVLPVVIHDAWHKMWDSGEKFGSRPGVIHISVLDPVVSTIQDTFENLSDRVFKKMDKKWVN